MKELQPFIEPTVESRQEDMTECQKRKEGVANSILAGLRTNVRGFDSTETMFNKLMRMSENQLEKIDQKAWNLQAATVALCLFNHDELEY